MHYDVISEVHFEKVHMRQILKSYRTFDEALKKVLSIVNDLNTESINSYGSAYLYRVFEIVVNDDGEYNLYPPTVCASFRFNYEE